MYNNNLHCQLICLFQVRSCAMETIVEVYRHVGVKVRTDLGKRSIPGSRMAILNAQFDAIDKDTNAVEEVGTEVCSVCVCVCMHTYVHIHLLYFVCANMQCPCTEAGQQDLY